ncbi:MAG: hypothetical protein AB7O45_07845 [Alphaproteobacteria bacterium]
MAWRRMGWSAARRGGAVLGLVLAAGAPAAADPSIGIELNRLEERGADCRAYLVLNNRGKDAYEAFKLDLVVFDKGGVIARRLAVDIGPLRAEKRGVKVFDLGGLACRDVSQILVNDVIECSGAKGREGECVGMIELNSRASAELSK